jgi:GntR family transcriptional regulator
VNPWDEPELVIEGGKPINSQLETQIRQQIRKGILRPGEELPTVRAVAVALAVRPQAVEEAYSELEREGLLTSGESCGPRVADLPSPAETKELENLCREFLWRAAALGRPTAEVVRVLHACLERGVCHGEPR